MLDEMLPYKLGDLVQLQEEVVARSDGFTFNERDAGPDGKLPSSWLRGADTIPNGTLCSFVGTSDEPGYAVVARDLMGRRLVVRLELLKLVSSIDDAVDETTLDASSLG